MATDYDQPRRDNDDEQADESLEALRASRADRAAEVGGEDEANLNEGLELPGADLSGEQLTVRVLPKQADEFTCTSCFLVHHQSRLARTGKSGPVCRDCT